MWRRRMRRRPDAAPALPPRLNDFHLPEGPRTSLERALLYDSFPETGHLAQHHVSRTWTRSTIYGHNYAYVDAFGRETVTWVRMFQMPGHQRRFDATMIYSDERQRIVDYLGTHQHLAVDLHLSVDKNGGLSLRSGEQRFYEWRRGVRFPLFFSGVVNVCEWYEADEERFRIRVEVTNPFWGQLFGYEGWFTIEESECRPCLLYTSDAADDLLCVDLGGRRIIKKKKNKITNPLKRHFSKKNNESTLFTH